MEKLALNVEDLYYNIVNKTNKGDIYMKKSLIKQSPEANELIEKFNEYYPVAFPLVFSYTELVWEDLATRTEKESFNARMKFKNLIAEVNEKIKEDAEEATFAFDFIYDSFYDSYLTYSFKEFRDRLKATGNNSHSKDYGYECRYADFCFNAIMAIKKVRRDYLYHRSDVDVLCRKVVDYFELLKEHVEQGEGSGDIETVHAFLKGYVEKNNRFAILAYSKIAFDELIIPVYKEGVEGTIVFDKRVSEITDEEKEDYDEGIVSLWGCFEYDRQKLFDEDTACQKLYENRLVDEFFAENKYPWRKTLSILKRIENIANNRYPK